MNQGSGPILKLVNVGVSYRRRKNFLRRENFWALRDVSLDVHRGDRLGVIGRNGAGKTTLLKVLAGILGPDTGRVERNGVRASLLSLQAGFLPQLTGRENAILSGMLLGMRRRHIESRMNHIIEFSELEDFIDEPLGTYSSGMRARLGFAVAFQADPDVLLVDEVMGVGDAAFREKSASAMRQKIRSNMTVVLVSHQPQTIRALCDRVLCIENGQTVAVGDVDTVTKNYEKTHSSTC